MVCLVLTTQKDSLRHKRIPTLDGKLPVVIGHRGASGYRPEHTLASYEVGIELGADFVEPDLVLTKDGVLVCRHEPMLSMTTNVVNLTEFAHKKTWKEVGGVWYNDWFASDFTLKELKKLRAIQTRAGRSKEYDGKFTIPTFDEMIALVKSKSKKYNRIVKVYPEMKEPVYHKAQGLSIEKALLKTLKREGWIHKDSPLIVQCFEVAPLQYIRSKTDVTIMQLINGDSLDKQGRMIMKAPYAQPYDFVVAGDPRTYNDLITSEGLDFIKSYADGIGAWTPFIIPYSFKDRNHDGKADDLNGDGLIDQRDYFKLEPTDLISRIHKKGLFVHGWTLRSEPTELLRDYHGDPKKEYRDYYRLGIDGLFTDFPDTALEVRKELFGG